MLVRRHIHKAPFCHRAVAILQHSAAVVAAVTPFLVQAYNTQSHLERHMENASAATRNRPCLEPILDALMAAVQQIPRHYKPKFHPFMDILFEQILPLCCTHDGKRTQRKGFDQCKSSTSAPRSLQLVAKFRHTSLEEAWKSRDCRVYGQLADVIACIDASKIA